MTGEKLVVIPGDIDYSRPLARFAKDFLDDVVMLLRPVNTTPERPDVDQIADDIERLEIILLQEGEQGIGVAAAGAEMHIGNPRRPIAIDAIDHHAFL